MRKIGFCTGKAFCRVAPPALILRALGWPQLKLTTPPAVKEGSAKFQLRKFLGVAYQIPIKLGLVSMEMTALRFTGLQTEAHQLRGWLYTISLTRP